MFWEMKWVVAAVIAFFFVLNSKFEILNPKWIRQAHHPEFIEGQTPNTKFSNYETRIERTSPPSPSPTLGEGGKQKFVLLDVPFTSQAPFGEWSDPRHQDGCEEAAALMAVAAMRQTTNPKPQIPKDLAKKEIDKAWDWQVEKYGNARDTSAEDTAERIIKNYFGHNGFMVKWLNGYEEIVDEVAKGSLVVVPVDGRGLNPNYTAPGPERHMIVVRGYDDRTGEFITNDPGTRKGEKYRYKYQKLFDAIRDYPTGNHEPISKMEKKMIVILKNYSNYSN